MTLTTCQGCNRPAFDAHTNANKTEDGAATECRVAFVAGSFVAGCAPDSPEKQWLMRLKGVAVER
jgi:hypothetical protein